MNGIIDEAVRLLSSMRLNTERGLSARGEQVHVVVDPEWDESEQRFRIWLLCHAPATDSPGWAGLPVLLERVDAPEAAVQAVGGATVANGPIAAAAATGPAPGSARTARPTESTRAHPAASATLQTNASTGAALAMVTRLDQRGQAMLRHVPAGEYRLAAGALWVEARAPLSLPLVLTSVDRRLTVSLRQEKSDRIEVTAEAADNVLYAASARFLFFDREDRVLQGGEVELQLAVPGAPRSGRWEAQIVLDAIGGFACQLLRHDDRPGATI